MEGIWTNVIYLTIFLCFLIYGLASSKRLNTKEVLRYSIYWLGIALILIILYSYRLELKRFTTKIAGELNPSSALLLSNGEITVNSSLDGHFYLNLRINGEKVRLMVDTGATDLTLSKHDAQKIGVDIRKLQFDKLYHTANGISYGASIKLNHISIANLEFKNVKASVNQGKMNNSLLGINFLKKFRKYEFTHNKLILTP